MREAQFNTEIMKSLRLRGAWAYKIADSPTSWTLRRTRFTPEKPCDIIVCFGGRFTAIEGKQMKKFRSFGLRDLRPYQIRNLDQIVKAGGRGFIFLNVRIRGAKKEGTAHANRLLIFDWKRWRERLEILPLSAKEIRGLPFISGSKGIYDLSSIFY